MTEQERIQRDILGLMTEDTHKFAIPITHLMTANWHEAFEALLIKDWVRLIDVSILGGGDREAGLYRIFRVMPDAVTWFRKTG